MANNKTEQPETDWAAFVIGAEPVASLRPRNGGTPVPDAVANVLDQTYREGTPRRIVAASPERAIEFKRLASRHAANVGKTARVSIQDDGVTVHFKLTDKQTRTAKNG